MEGSSFENLNLLGCDTVLLARYFMMFHGYVVPCHQGLAVGDIQGVGGEKMKTEMWGVKSSGVFCCVDW